MSRITEPTEGRVHLRGRVASLLEVGTGFHPELTGYENIYLNGAILGMTRAEIKKKFDEIVDFAGVEKFLDTPVKRYSSGMHVLLAFAVAAHLEPEILVVDEVLSVGDIEFQKKCLGKMSEVAHRGRTVLFVSHNMAAVQRLCQKGILLNAGSIEVNGLMDSVIQYYLSCQVDSSSRGKENPTFKNRDGIEIHDIIYDRSNDDLELRVRISVQEITKNVGIGIRVVNQTGDIVIQLKPYKTGFIISAIKTEKMIEIRLKEFYSLLPEGHYRVDLWLADPGIEIYLDCEGVAEVDIPFNDRYQTGQSMRQNEDGIVLLGATVKEVS